MLCVQAKRRQIQPSLDWTKANSFQVMEAVTEGRDVMPRRMDRAKARTPIKRKVYKTDSDDQ